MSASMSDPSTIRCRPHPGYWFFALLALVFASLPWLIPGAVRTPDDHLGAAVVGLIFGGSGIGLIAWIVMNHVEADALGLRWRTLHGARSVLWSGVSDYYEPVLKTKQNYARSVIETAAGTLTVAEGLWTNVEAFRAVVRERATSAKARDWGIKGARPEDDWPQTFTYDARRLRSVLWPVYIVAIAFLAFFTGFMGPKFARVIGEIGWGLGLAMIACTLVVPVFMPVFIIYAMAPVSSGLRRLGHRITVDPDGIVFENGHRRIASPWAGVTALRLIPVGGLRAMFLFVIATSQGEITFVRSIEDAVLLRAAVERFTGKTFAMDTAGDRLTPPTAEETLGVARVYTYRNRTVRALLWLATAETLITLVMGALSYTGRMDATDLTGPAELVFGALLAAFTAWAWRRYRTVSIRTDGLGITWCGPGRRIFIPWSDVRACKAQKADMATFTTIRGSREKIHVWFGISGYEALRAEVASRAPALAANPDHTMTSTR